jgi:hypothetical protein
MCVCMQRHRNRLDDGSSSFAIRTMTTFEERLENCWELVPLDRCICHNDSTYKAVHKTYDKTLRHLRGCLIIVPFVFIFERWRYGAPRRMVRVGECVDPLAGERITRWFS